MTTLKSAEFATPGASNNPPNRTAPKGFTGRLQGASLFDLVQLECLAGTHHVVRVISRNQAGYLYFDGGNLVHAVCRSLLGEAAAFEILGWENGLFEPCDLPWPSVPSITKSWQNLLMLAAQAGDESRHAAASSRRPGEKTALQEGGGKVLEFPSDRSAEQFSSVVHQQRGPSVSNDPSSNSRLTSSGETSGIVPTTNGHPSAAASTAIASPGLSRAPSTNSVPAKPPALANTLVQAAVRLDTHGNVLTSRGEGHEMVGAVTYSTRVAQLIADSLGLGELKSIELETERYKSFIHRESDGQLLAVRANRDVDLSRIKDKLGL